MPLGTPDRTVGDVSAVGHTHEALVAAAVDQIQASDPTIGAEVGMLVRVNRAGTLSLSRVTVGAVDSGGVGFRLLRVAN